MGKIIHSNYRMQITDLGNQCVMIDVNLLSIILPRDTFNVDAVNFASKLLGTKLTITDKFHPTVTKSITFQSKYDIISDINGDIGTAGHFTIEYMLINDGNVNPLNQLPYIFFRGKYDKYTKAGMGNVAEITVFFDVHSYIITINTNVGSNTRFTPPYLIESAPLPYCVVPVNLSVGFDTSKYTTLSCFAKTFIGKIFGQIMKSNGYDSDYNQSSTRQFVINDTKTCNIDSYKNIPIVKINSYGSVFSFQTGKLPGEDNYSIHYIYITFNDSAYTFQITRESTIDTGGTFGNWTSDSISYP